MFEGKFIVKVSKHTAMNKKEEKTVKAEAARARELAELNGFNPKTQQRMTDHNGCFYVFSK